MSARETPITVPIRLLPREERPRRPPDEQASGASSREGREGVSSRAGAPAALYVEGGDPARWLRAAHEAGLPAAGTRVLVVPRSARERVAAGALLIPPEGHAPRRTPQALACRCRAGRLYFPEDALLSPDPTDAEIGALLGPEVALLLPRTGLTGAAREELVPLLSLVLPPPFAREDWSGALTGRAPERRVTAVEPLEPPRLEAIFAPGKDDIGSRSGERIPGRPKGAKGGAAGAGAGAGAEGRDGAGDARDAKDAKDAKDAEGAKGAKDGKGGKDGKDGEDGKDAKYGGGEGRGGGTEGAAAGEKAGEGGLSGALGRIWEALSDAARALKDGIAGAVDPALGTRREEALERLLRLLDEDPEEGLRYALPIGERRENKPRGVAPPTGALSRRDDPSFDLGRLSGGGAADPWAASAKTVEELRRRYRELAARELALGRHRRAAYILAELLRDLEGAAAALRAGRHFREAAAVYRDLLHRPEAAAECLEAGGHLGEAAALYESERRYERAGDLRTRLGERALAEVLYRKAAVACEEGRAFLSAARIYEGKLERPELALAALERGSHDPSQSAVCLGERFRILGKLERHDAALAEVAALRDASPAPYRTQALVEAFSGIGERYPEAAVRALALDAARVVVGRRIEGGMGASEAEALLALVVRAHSRDKLLFRDARRFVDERKQREAEAAREARSSLFAAARGGRRSEGRRFQIVRRFSIGAGGWRAAVRAGDAFVAAGVHHSWGFAVARFTEVGALAHAQLEGLTRAGGPHGLQLAALDGPDRPRIVLFEPGVPPVPTSAVGGSSFAPVDVGTPAWLPPDAVGIGAGTGVFHVVRRDDEELLLATYTYGGSELSLVRIAGKDELRLEGVPRAVHFPVLATPDGVLVGAGEMIYLLRDPLWREDRRHLALPWPAHAIAAAHPLGSRRIAVTHAEGVSLLACHEEVRPGKGQMAYKIGALLAPEMARPLAAFTGEGALALISREGGPLRLYALEGARPRFVGESDLGERGERLAPVALLPGERPTDLVLLDTTGRVLVIRAPLSGA